MACKCLYSPFLAEKRESGSPDLDFTPFLLVLNIQCFNINKVDDLCITLKEFTDLKFLCFSETWASEESC
nr:unnamed protein product [Callosobruchus analis]